MEPFLHVDSVPQRDLIGLTEAFEVPEALPASLGGLPLSAFANVQSPVPSFSSTPLSSSTLTQLDSEVGPKRKIPACKHLLLFHCTACKRTE